MERRGRKERVVGMEEVKGTMGRGKEEYRLGGDETTSEGVRQR